MAASNLRGIIHCMFLLGCIHHVAAQWQYVSPVDRGYCTFDFDNPSGYFAYNGIDAYPMGDTVGSGASDHPFLVICKFNFIGQASVVTQSTTYRHTAIVPTIVVPFTNVPVTTLAPGSNVECTAVAGTTYDGFFQVRETFALNSATQIQPFVTSTTVVVPTSVVTTSTSTSILTQQTETTVTPDTVTSTVATGTKTVLGKPTLTTKTISITLVARMAKKVAITYTTTTLSCIPPKTGRGRDRRENRALAIARAVFERQENTNIETATCFGQQVAPTIINTSLTTTTSTETLVEPTLTTTTIVNTIVAPAPTVIQHVRATSTLTLTFTRYKWTVLPRATVTSTISLVNTVTKLPGTKLKPCVKPTAVPGPAPGAPGCKNPTTTMRNGCQKLECR